MSFKIVPSGLTEPLFANFLTFAILAYLSGWSIIATIFISFMPFIRSEGLIILILALSYLLIIKRWHVIPFLTIGHLVLGLLGMKYFDGDFLWTLHNVPYPVNEGFYGSGDALHFISLTPNMIGPTITVLFIVGLLLVMIGHNIILQKLSSLKFWILIILVIGSIIGFYFFHSIAWATGRFNSLGLTRVMFGILPMISIIAVIPFEFLEEVQFKLNFKSTLIYSLISLHLFMLYSGEYSLKWNDYHLKTSQNILVETVKKLKKFEPDYSQRLLLYDAPFISVLLNIDPYGNGYERCTSILDKSRVFPLNTIIIWDQYYSGIHSKINLDSLVNDNRLVFLFETNQYNEMGQKEKCAVFKIKPEYTLDYSLPEIHKKLEAIKEDLVRDITFFPKVEKQAYKLGISIDSCLNLNAKYFLERKKKETF
ncbi:MAG: hypothetical protein IPJ53_10160 [Saprospiraceae bacterium]|nr:hypothetical protein [Candidatus Vicinibacter affinis]